MEGEEERKSVKSKSLGMNNREEQERRRKSEVKEMLGLTLKMIAFLARLHSYVLMLTLFELYRAELSISCTWKSFRFKQLF